ncbi:hypothetical protein MHY_27850 [Megamonas hypermegale ART12/1]|jgi:hypothetical protein|nr:hypothetical protein MHY_27850 [Megamonas hypermegale ART12/1]
MLIYQYKIFIFDFGTGFALYIKCKSEMIIHSLIINFFDLKEGLYYDY